MTADTSNDVCHVVSYDTYLTWVDQYKQKICPGKYLDVYIPPHLLDCLKSEAGVRDTLVEFDGTNVFVRLNIQDVVKFAIARLKYGF